MICKRHYYGVNINAEIVVDIVESRYMSVALHITSDNKQLPELTNVSRYLSYNTYPLQATDFLLNSLLLLKVLIMYSNDVNF